MVVCRVTNEPTKPAVAACLLASDAPRDVSSAPGDASPALPPPSIQTGPLSSPPPPMPPSPEAPPPPSSPPPPVATEPSDTAASLEDYGAPPAGTNNSSSPRAREERGEDMSSLLPPLMPTASLQVFHIGDSGLLIFRNGRLLHSTSKQTRATHKKGGMHAWWRVMGSCAAVLPRSLWSFKSLFPPLIFRGAISSSRPIPVSS
jgi:hypothetical protein